MTIYAEPPEVVPGQVMSATNWKDWVVDVSKAMWVYSAAGDIAYALSANQKARLAIGTSQSLLMSNGSAPTWLAKGAANQVLGVNAGGTALEWKSNIGIAKGAYVYNSSFSLPHNVRTAVSFAFEAYDDNNYWNIGNPTQVTIPESGWYVVSAYISYANNSSGIRETQIAINGTLNVVAIDNRMPVTGDVTVVTIAGVHYFTAGSYVQFKLFQNSGGSMTVTSAVLEIAKL